MPLPNRVTPFGEIVATLERGTLFCNRGGRIHDPATRTLLRRRYTSRRWICCVLDFKGRRRQVFGPGYTELFFLDEATGLAAGHRPCFECRRSRFLAFRDDFEFATAATDTMAAFNALRARHDPPARKIIAEAQTLFRQGRRDEGYAKAKEVVETYYASSSYRLARKWLAERR